MFTFQCDFHFKSGSAEDLWDPLSFFLSALINNGQILESAWYPLRRQGRIRMFLVAPARDALSSRHFNPECARTMKELRRALSRAPVYRYEGLNVESPGDCRCRRPPRFILMTNFLSERPPVLCGDCDRLVPLYRLPYPEDQKDYRRFRKWMALYRACDELQMDSGFGESFGLKHMCGLKSPLTRMGRALCRDMTKRTKRPFYYYLHGYEKPLNRPCPGCGRPWRLDVPDLRFTHRCDPCALVCIS